jgi:hypothetical protein
VISGLAKPFDLVQARAESTLRPDDAARFPHCVAETTLERSRKLLSGPREGVELSQGIGDDRSRPREGFDLGRIRGCCLTRPPPGDQRLAERVAAEPIRPMEATDAFAGREQATHVRRMRVGLDEIPPME